MGCCHSAKPPPPPAAAPDPASTLAKDAGLRPEWMKQFNYLFQRCSGDTSEQDMAVQLEELEQTFGLDELNRYVIRAQTLLKDAQKRKHIFEGCKVEAASPSHGLDLTQSMKPGSRQFGEFEECGENELEHCVFCLVAGSSGDHLGLQMKCPLKIAMLAEVTTETTFMGIYAEYILAFQAKARQIAHKQDIVLPLIIMTSDDTDAQTREFMRENNDFGLSDVRYVKQVAFPAFSNVDGHFATDDALKIVKKRRGHGDVHRLLYAGGFHREWDQSSKKWLVLFQDTNPIQFRCFCAVLGVSIKNNFAMNSMVVHRHASEVIGGIAQITDPSGSSMMLNVEPAQLSKWDHFNANDFSRFPGNTNLLVLKLDEWKRCLDGNGGDIDEFMDPSWSDANKTKVSDPVVLANLMQDFPKIAKGAKIGFTLLDRRLCFTRMRNGLQDARFSNPAECALTCEADIYRSHTLALMHAAECAHTEFILSPSLESNEYFVTFENISAAFGPRVVIRPSFGVSMKDMSRNLKGAIKIKNDKKRSALVLEGQVIFEGEGQIEALSLDGAMVLRAAANSPISIKGLNVYNDGQKMKAIDATSRGAAKFKRHVESYLLRGFAPDRQLAELYSHAESWDGAALRKAAGDLTGGGTFMIKEKKLTS